jgi:hypothetical protein
MAGAEMTIRLVDGTEAEQAAFNQPATDTGASRADFGYDAKQSLASVQQSLAALANRTATGNESDQQSGTGREATGLDGLTRDDVREWRLALVDLAEKFTPKFFAEPIERLIAALGGNAQTAGSQTAPVPTVGHVAPRQESNAMGDMFASLQRQIGNTRLGRGVNTAIRGARNIAGRARNVARSVGRALNNTRAGRAVTGMARRAAGRIANSGFGRAVAGAGRSVGGAIARTVGSVASGAVASGGTASVAAGSGATAAAGAAGAAALANPVGIAVAAVVAAFAGLAIATKVLNDTFSAEADRLEKYSASIAIARGNQRINTELNMIDRARRLGGPLGGLENSKTALNDSMEKLWTEILFVLSGFAPLLQTGVDGLTFLTSKMVAAMTKAELESAEWAVWRAGFTKDLSDDIAAGLVANDAAIRHTAAMQRMTDSFDRLVGNAPNAGPGGDPFLRSLLNAKVGP